MGLHVGEFEVAKGKPSEAVAETARRVAETAAPGEILLTRTLRDILAGTGFTLQGHDSPMNGRPADVGNLFRLVEKTGG